MDDEDNTLLWIALGAALVYFFMRQNATASPTVPLLPAPSGGWGGSSGSGASTGVTFNASNPGEIPVPSVTPGGAVVIPGENSSSITLDPIFGMNPGEPYSWD